MVSHTQKAEAFKAMHEGPGAFVIPNPWDVGGARLLQHMGFKALATTSAGAAVSAGKRDGEVGRDAMIAHCALLSGAVDVPVSGDLEDCYAPTPDGVAETIRMAANAGLAGCSIEDARRDRDTPIYQMAEAVDRVRAAVDAARALDVPFTVTARAENFLFANPDLADTIARLQAFQEAGADVLYAPGLRSADEIADVVRSVDKPVNAVMGIGKLHLSVREFAALGVRRVSTGSAMFRAAYTGLARAAEEIAADGTFTFLDNAMASAKFLRALD